MAPYTVLDLFAGAGGFSLGFEMAGFAPVAAVEIDDWACATLRRNFPEKTIAQLDLSEIEDGQIKAFGRVDALIGGPPCQGFSVAGPTQFGVSDERNSLVEVLLRFAAALQPSLCVIENVPGIATRSVRGGITVPDRVKEVLGPLGYRLRTATLNAVEFGVPQQRRRFFIVACRSGLNWGPPETTHSAGLEAIEGPGLFTAPRQRPLSVWEAISDLPQIGSGEGTDEPVPYQSPPQNAFQELMREGSDGVRNHVAMKHTSRLIERFRAIPQGASLKDAPLQHGQRMNRTGGISDTPYKYNNYRLRADTPSLAVAASFQSSFLHPFLHRNLTAREAARLMSFPDRFAFCGKRTTMSWEKGLSQYNQIGNAVCPLVSRALARSCQDALEGSGVPPTAWRPGPLRDLLAQRVNHRSSTEPSPLRDSDAGFLQVLGETAQAHLNVVNGGLVRAEGFMLPAHLIACALLFATERECPLCDPAREPYGRHHGSIPFLISKDGIDTLLVRGKDHGLDYHLRAVSGLTHECAHIVGRIVERSGLGFVEDVVNPRTGRKVTGLRVSACPAPIERHRPELRRLVASLASCRSETSAMNGHENSPSTPRP
ncbi:MAG: DNA cytosine methyltransferase [Gemmataceae bacterium]|nr:DNA cytosine methyltransferase [Gemmataceae bacterium]